MKKIRLKLDEDVFEELKSIANSKKMDRNRYIHDALRYYNRLEKRKILAERIASEARLVKKDSIRILREFEDFSATR